MTDDLCVPAWQAKGEIAFMPPAPEDGHPENTVEGEGKGHLLHITCSIRPSTSPGIVRRSPPGSGNDTLKKPER